MVWCSNICRGVSCSPARRARETTWMERMLSPPSSKKLSSHPHARPAAGPRPRSPPASAPRGCAAPRSPPPPAASSGAGRARRSTLPLGVSGSASSAHEGGRHHVLRQPVRAACARSSSAASASPDHVGHEPLLAGASSRTTTTRPPRRGARRSTRLDLAQLDAEAAHLHLRRPGGPGTPARRPPVQRTRSPVRYIRAPGRRRTDRGRSARP